MTDPRDGPVLVDLGEEESTPDPAEAPPVPDPDGPQPSGQAMQTVATLAARPRSRLARWLWAGLAALVGFMVSVALWRFVTDLLAASPVLGVVAAALVALVALLVVLIALKEAAAYARLSRLDDIHRAANAAVAAGDLGAARAVIDRLGTLYAGRADLAWGRERLEARRGDVFDAASLFDLAEREVMAPMDAAATREVEAAARQVATITALVPLAFADVIAALTANLAMIRRIAEIYGGRAGTLGAWRLTRAVLTHLVATGAVAVGDDLIGSVAGGSILGRVSRRFGEGVVNGALTARVGVAAMEVCRPLPFAPRRAPRVTQMVRRALAGLFGAPR